MKKKAVYYEDDKNVRPVEDFINGLDQKYKTKVLSRITLLQEHWQELRRPYVDFLQGGLYELRVVLFGNQVRVIYAYMFKDYIVLLHGFNKTTDDVPKPEYKRGIFMKNKIIVAKSIDQHIQEEFKRNPEFKKAYAEEVTRLQIGWKIAQLRQMRHLSQAQLAKRVKTSQQTISRLEDLKDARINLNTLAKLAAALKARLSIDLIPT